MLVPLPGILEYTVFCITSHVFSVIVNLANCRSMVVRRRNDEHGRVHVLRSIWIRSSLRVSILRRYTLFTMFHCWVYLDMWSGYAYSAFARCYVYRNPGTSETGNLPGMESVVPYLAFHRLKKIIFITAYNDTNRRRDCINAFSL